MRIASSISLRKFLLPTSFAALTGFTVGCVITTGGGSADECGSILSHSQETSSGGCVCDPGYQWEDPEDDDNHHCDPIPGKAGDCNEPNSFLDGDTCFCDGGYNWCQPNNPNDFTCCEDPDQAMDGGTGSNDDNDDVNDDATDGADSETDDGVDETGGEVCEETPTANNGVTPDDADCAEDGLAFCSNTEAEGPAGSIYYECVRGAWVAQATVGDEICQFDGFEFSYGCVDTEDGILFECGTGPGTDCSGPECSGCLDSDILQDCSDGKLGEASCFQICTVDGDAEGITYDFGSCIDGEAGPECACCDEGDEDCEIG